jgi:hypothetical protein
MGPSIIRDTSADRQLSSSTQFGRVAGPEQRPVVQQLLALIIGLLFPGQRSRDADLELGLVDPLHEIGAGSVDHFDDLGDLAVCVAQCNYQRVDRSGQGNHDPLPSVAARSCFRL